jgi:hypothetical protein
MTRLARIMNAKLPLKVRFDVGQKSRGAVTPKAGTPSVWHEYLMLRVQADIMIDGRNVHFDPKRHGDAVTLLNVRTSDLSGRIAHRATQHWGKIHENARRLFL